MPAVVAPLISSTGLNAAIYALPEDERELFQHLTSELRRLRQLPVHEVLGVARDAGPEELRLGWDQQRLRGEIFANCQVLSERATDDAAYFQVRASPAVLARFKGLLG